MGIYQQIYDLIHQFIFGGVEMTANMDLVAVLMSTCGTVAVVSIPIVLMYKIIRWCF